MKQLYCKNCGAPIEHRYTHRCRYCDTVIFSDEEDDQEEDEEIDIDLELYNCDKFNSVKKEIYEAIKDSLNKVEEEVGEEGINNIVKIFKGVLLTITPTIVIAIIISILIT